MATVRRSWLALLALPALAGCANVLYPLTHKSPYFDVRGPLYESAAEGYHFVAERTVAVLSGDNYDGDLVLAAELTHKLADAGRFRVLSQEEIGKRLPRYPLNFHLIDFSAREGMTAKDGPFMSETSVRALRRLHKALRADYVFVVWSEGASISTEVGGMTVSSYFVSVFGRYLELPSGRVVGSTAAWVGRDRASEPEEADIRAAAEYASDTIAKQILASLAEATR